MPKKYWNKIDESEAVDDKNDDEPTKENFFLAAIKSSMMNATVQLIEVGAMSTIGLLFSKLVHISKPLPIKSTQSTNQNLNGVDVPAVDLEIPVVNF